MAKQRFVVGIAGDSGVDRCVFDTTSDPPDRAHSPSAISTASVEVPAGAALIAEALESLLSHPNAKLQHNRLNVVQLFQESRRWNRHHIMLRRFRSPVEPDGETWRISRRFIPDDLDNSNLSTTAHVPRSKGLSPADLEMLIILDAHAGWRQSESAGKLTKKWLRTIQQTRSQLSGKPGPNDIFAVVDLDARFPHSERKHTRRTSSNTPADNNPALLFNENDEPFWHAIADSEFASNICVMCSSRQLRASQAAISRHLSWELTVETLAAELRLFDPLRMLTRFGHVIIRFGCFGAVYLHHEVLPANESTRLSGHLIFAPRVPAGVYRDSVEEGDVVGYKTLLAASLACSLATNKGRMSPQGVVESIRTGLVAGMRLFDRGYRFADLGSGEESGSTRKLKNGKRKGHVLVSQAFQQVADTLWRGYRAEATSRSFRKEHILGVVPIPRELLGPPASHLANFGSSYQHANRWDILRTSLNNIDSVEPTSLEVQPSAHNLSFRLNYAMAVGLYGHEHVLNRNIELKAPVRRVLEAPDPLPSFQHQHDCITLNTGDLPEVPHAAGASTLVQPPTRRPEVYVPLITFGKLAIIERDEIENLRGVRTLIREYARTNARSPESSRPLSIAVFGAPGVGKSFAIKQIRDSVNASLSVPKRPLESIDFNVAQFRSIDDLAKAARAISTKNHNNKTPLVFFDEFDTPLNNEPLGWLRYFLAPMQDGFFYGPDGEISFGPAVFVFAGGTHSRFEQFARNGTLPPRLEMSPTESHELELFRERKGPDFVSRLSAHVNILPIDRAAGEYKCVLRRALIINQIMKDLKRVRTADGIKDQANIDPDVLYALLTVDRYRHGVRSLESLLSMCVPIQGQIGKASLPARDQLNMHVNAEEFYVRIYRGRVRRLGDNLPRTSTESSNSSGDRPLASPILSTKRSAKGSIKTKALARGGKVTPRVPEKMKPSTSS